MARRKSVDYTRDIGVDIKYGSEVVEKFINIVLECGKKNTARRIVYEAMDALEKKAGGSREKGLSLFHKAVESATPLIEVRGRRVGGSVYQVPVQVTPKRGRALAFRWLVNAAKQRNDKTMGQRLAYELLDAIEGRGNAVKKKQDVQRMAESNRAFAHYAW